jgi:hypothetical protein
MRMAIDPTESVSVPEYHETEPLWLIRGKDLGKICRSVRFMPARERSACAASIQKSEHCQSLESFRGVGTAFA